jgi:hypothetical protein
MTTLMARFGESEKNSIVGGQRHVVPNVAWTDAAPMNTVAMIHSVVFGARFRSPCLYFCLCASVCGSTINKRPPGIPTRSIRTNNYRLS